MIIYFSGTGNSRYVAQFLAKQLGDGLLDAGRELKENRATAHHSERPFVFVAPTYAWRLPHVFSDYIRTANFSGNRDAYFVLTCGSDIGNAGAYITRLCQDVGFHDCGTLEVVMPENYIAMFSVPDREESIWIIEKAMPVLMRGAELIRQGKPFSPKNIHWLDRLKSGPVNPAFYKFFVKADAFRVTDACTGCGLCTNLCPLNNVSLQDEIPVWGSHCTHCMACICGCPAEAIEYGRKSRGAPRYQCPIGPEG